MTRLQAWTARGVLIALAAYLTWRHVQHWHLDELMANPRAVPWIAGSVPFESVSAILVALAWLAALLFPLKQSVRSASLVGVGAVLVAVTVAAAVQITSQTAAAAHYARTAANQAQDAEGAAERAADAAENAASEASDAKDACEQE